MYRFFVEKRKFYLPLRQYFMKTCGCFLGCPLFQKKIINKHLPQFGLGSPNNKQNHIYQWSAFAGVFYFIKIDRGAKHALVKFFKKHFA